MKKRRTLQDLTDNQLACRRGHHWSLPTHINITTGTHGDIVECTEVVRCVRQECTHRRETRLSVPSMEPVAKSASRYKDVDPSYAINETVTVADIRKEQFLRGIRR